METVSTTEPDSARVYRVCQDNEGTFSVESAQLLSRCHGWRKYRGEDGYEWQENGSNWFPSPEAAIEEQIRREAWRLHELESNGYGARYLRQRGDNVQSTIERIAQLGALHAALPPTILPAPSIGHATEAPAGKPSDDNHQD